MKRTAWVMALALWGCGGTRLVGEPCRAHADCASLPDGYCARAEICTRTCDESQPCPDGSACVWGGGRRVCLARCATDDACPPGFACDVGGEAAVCRLKQPLAPPPE